MMGRPLGALRAPWVRVGLDRDHSLDVRTGHARISSDLLDVLDVRRVDEAEQACLIREGDRADPTYRAPAILQAVRGVL